MNIFAFYKHLNKVLKRYKQQTGIEGHLMAYYRDKFYMLKDTAKEWDVPFLWLLCDFLLTMLIHGESSEYYVMSEIYKCSFAEKCRRLTVFRGFTLDYKYNIKATEEEKQRLFDKKLFNIYYKDYIGREWRYAPDETPESLRTFIQQQKNVFCKPYNLSWGAGIFVLSAYDVTDETIQKLIDQHYIVEEIIDQHPAMKAIHPESVNTVRIFSIIDRLGVPHITMPYLRAGIGESATDNICTGGIFYIIDPDTGIVSMAGRNELEQKRYVIHPGSDVVMPGFRVPYYKELCEMLKKAALVTPSLRYVGWDVAIAPNGPVLIEGNIEFAQVAQGIDGLYREAKQYL